MHYCFCEYYTVSYLKFSAVLGTTSARSSISILPFGDPPIVISKNTTGFSTMLSVDCFLSSKVTMCTKKDTEQKNKTIGCVVWDVWCHGAFVISVFLCFVITGQSQFRYRIEPIRYSGTVQFMGPKWMKNKCVSYVRINFYIPVRQYKLLSLYFMITGSIPVQYWSTTMVICNKIQILRFWEIESRRQLDDNLSFFF